MLSSLLPSTWLAGIAVLAVLKVAVMAFSPIGSAPRECRIKAHIPLADARRYQTLARDPLGDKGIALRISRPTPRLAEHLSQVDASIATARELFLRCWCKSDLGFSESRERAPSVTQRRLRLICCDSAPPAG